MHIYKQYTDFTLHILSQMSCNYWIKFTTFQQQDKDMFFFFPLVEVYCVGVYVNIVFFFFSFDSSSQMKRTMCHTSKEIIQPNSLYALIVHI